MNDKAMCRNDGKGENWILGFIVQVVSPVTYLVDVGKKGGAWKRYVNRLIDKKMKNKYIT